MSVFASSKSVKLWYLVDEGNSNSTTLYNKKSEPYTENLK